MNDFPCRKEYKYLVPNDLIPELRAVMKPYVEIDKFAAKDGTGEYTIRSIYYDTLNLDFYDEKKESVKSRKKLRVRVYNDPNPDSVVFLEVKKKVNGLTIKHRAPFLHKNFYNLFSTVDIDKYILSFSGNGKEKDDARRFFYHIYRRSMRPMVLVVYDREPFFCKFDSTIRVTFDKNIRSAIYTSFDTFYGNSPIKHCAPNHFVLEVKFNSGLPAWMIDIIKDYQFKKISFSKYTICIDSHRLLRTASKPLHSPALFNQPVF